MRKRGDRECIIVGIAVSPFPTESASEEANVQIATFTSLIKTGEFT
jgi:hypothetical protein